MKNTFDVFNEVLRIMIRIPIQNPWADSEAAKIKRIQKSPDLDLQ